MPNDVKVRKQGHELDGAIFENAASNDILGKIAPSLKEVGKKVTESGKKLGEKLDEQADSNKGPISKLIGGMDGFIGGLTGVLGAVGNGLLTLTKDVFDQNATVTNTVENFGKVLGSIGKGLTSIAFKGIGGTLASLTGFQSALEGIGKVIHGGVGAIENYSRTMDYMSNAGMLFGGDILDMKNTAAEARMELSKYADMMRNNKEQLAGVGGTMTEAAKAFSSYSNDFFNSTEEYGMKLRQLGYSYDDVNEMILFNRKMNQMTNLEDERAREKSMLSTMQLATEMDTISKL